MKTHASIIFMCFAILSCGRPRTSFEQPQPRQTENLVKIPIGIQGTYLSEEDSTYLSILISSIKERGTAHSKESINNLKSEIQSFGLTESDLQKDTTLSIISDGIEINLKIQGDSALFDISIESTLFKISDTNLFREKNGIYFFSIQKKDENDWQIYTLQKTKNGVLFNKSLSSIDIDSLKQITRVDSVMNSDNEVELYKIDPSFKELLELMELSNNSITKYIKVD